MTTSLIETETALQLQLQSLGFDPVLNRLLIRSNEGLIQIDDPLNSNNVTVMEHKIWRYHKTTPCPENKGLAHLKGPLWIIVDCSLYRLVCSFHIQLTSFGDDI